MKSKQLTLALLTVSVIGLLFIPVQPAFATGRAEQAAEARPIVWKFPIASVPGEPYYDLYAQHLKDEIEARTNGRLTIEMFSETEIGTGPEIVLGLQTGAVEMHSQAFSILQSYVPEVSFLSLPFIIEDKDHMARFMETAEGRDLLRAGEDYGVYIFRPGVMGYLFPVARNRVLPTLEDFRGFNMRVIENTMHIDTMRALGANPVVLPYGEVYTGMRTGIVDGYVNDRTSFVYLSIYEVGPYYTELPVFVSGVSMVVSKAAFDALPPDIQIIVREVIEEAVPIVQAYSWEYNVAGDPAWKGQMFREYVSMEEITLEPFVKAVAPLYDRFLRENPGQRRFVEAVDRVR
ncbi:MAG: TRAP transporter substrate-binding protein [Spirochaetaceae bacterium]|nr:MAG: TRAP transporter substrate-binding protein [Spirochaetaceae bacterium]